MTNLDHLARRLRLQAVAATVTRLMIGQAFILTGWGKLHSLEKVTQFFTDLGIPFPAANATFIATLEFVGGIALIAGFGTRIFAALLSATMIVALMTADRADFVNALAPSPTKGLTEVVPFAYLVFLGWLVACGPGPLSVDHLLVTRRGRSSASTTAAVAK